MSKQPLSSNDLAKILIFILLLLPIIGFGFGVIPVIFLVFGVFMMKKTQEFSHIETAVKNFRTYMQLAIVVGVLLSLNIGFNNQYGWYSEDFFAVLTLSLVPIFYIVIINKLFYEPLRDHSEWLEVNGFFANKKFFDPSGKQMDVDIIKREKLKSYFVADELIKWVKLKEDGHITQEEYDVVRKKLLKKG